MLRLNDDDTDNTPVGRIRRVMAVRSITLRALSERTRVPYRTLQSNLSKTHSLKIETLIAICETLSISADYVLTGNSAVFDPEALADAIKLLNEFEQLGVAKGSYEEKARVLEECYYTAFMQNMYDIEPSRLSDVFGDIMGINLRKDAGG